MANTSERILVIDAQWTAAGPVATLFNLQNYGIITTKLDGAARGGALSAVCCNRFSDNVHRCWGKVTDVEILKVTDSYQDYYIWMGDIQGLIDLILKILTKGSDASHAKDDDWQIHSQ